MFCADCYQNKYCLTSVREESALHVQKKGIRDLHKNRFLTVRKFSGWSMITNVTAKKRGVRPGHKGADMAEASISDNPKRPDATLLQSNNWQILHCVNAGLSKCKTKGAQTQKPNEFFLSFTFSTSRSTLCFIIFFINPSAINAVCTHLCII